MKKITINIENQNQLELIIDSIKDKIKPSQIFILLFVISMYASAIHHIIVENKMAAKVFLTLCCLLISYMAIKLWNNYKWKILGTEVIKISEDQLIITKKLFSQTKTNTFNINDISISTEESSENSIFKYSKGTFIISKKNHEKIANFGKFLSDEEINIIIRKLESYITVVPRKTKPKVQEDDNDSFIKIRKKAFLILIIPCVGIGFFNSKNNIDKYNLLKENGTIINVISKFKKNWDTNYYNFYFIASNGQKVEGGGKCHDIETFERDFKNIKVIYNPLNPEGYMKYSEFENFSTTQSQIVGLIFPIFIA